MCDYSLHCVASRDAEATDTLVVTGFYGTSSRGFASPNELSVAVCLRPGTEVAFEEEACREGALFKRRLGAKVARFRQVDRDHPDLHHDALEFPGGAIVKVNELVIGQRIRVVQLPAEPKAEEAQAPEQEAPIAAAQLMDC
jgi:hypothetical protein